MREPHIGAVEDRPSSLRSSRAKCGQRRSIEKRARVAEGAIEVLASHGVAGLTHRLVAKSAGVSLAATTYHFDSKFDLIGAATALAMANYTESIRRAAERFKRTKGRPDSFRRFAVSLIRGATKRDRHATIAWAEIILDGRRHPEALALSRHLFSQLPALWSEIAESAGLTLSEDGLRSVIDVVIGFLMMTVTLGLSQKQVDAVLTRKSHPVKAWHIDSTTYAREPVDRLSGKAQATKERIISASIDLLIAAGPSAISHRAVAERAGLSATAPGYYYPTIGDLLAATQQRLFADSKRRYREAAVSYAKELDEESFVDRTTTAFLREATEFGGASVARFGIWLQSSRQPELRPIIWDEIADQNLAWERVLRQISKHPRPFDPMLAQTLFAGKLVRILATGSTTADLSLVRREFAESFRALASGTFWM